MPLSRDEVLHIARLARVGLSEEDVLKFQAQLSHILEQFEVLRHLDSEGIEPTAHTLPLQNVMRPDMETPSLPRKSTLANAPEVEEGLFRVRAVLE